MRGNEVVALSLQERKSYSVVLDRYRFDPKRGWLWLQRLCFSILNWLGCHDHEITVSHERHVIDGDRLLDRIWNQNDAVRRHLEHFGEFRLLIGAEDYAQLMQEAVSDVPFRYSAVAHGGRNGRPTVFDMEVSVVPWMRGYVVLPEEWRW